MVTEELIELLKLHPGKLVVTLEDGVYHEVDDLTTEQDVYRHADGSLHTWPEKSDDKPTTETVLLW